MLSLDSFLSARQELTGSPLRIRWGMPSAHPMQSGGPSGVTGANTIPSTGMVLCSSPTDIADPFKPFRKSLVPSLGSTTQHQAFPVRMCPVSSPQKSQLSRLRSSGLKIFSISTSIAAFSPWPRGPSGRFHSSDSKTPAR
ncbi:hypothetical protein D3C72_935780 [compost metagenome]